MISVIVDFLLFALNDYKTSIDEYSGGIKLEPQNVTLLISRAVAYLEFDSGSYHFILIIHV